MNTQIIFRPAQLSDQEAIAQLHAASWQYAYRGIYSDDFLDHKALGDRRELWHARLSEPVPGRVTTLALADDTLAGFACLELDEDAVYGSWLDNLHVSRAFQGSGVGKALIRECAARIIREGTKPGLYLWVYEKNIKARDFYDRLGALNRETMLIPKADGDPAPMCRYVWPDAAALL